MLPLRGDPVYDLSRSHAALEYTPRDPSGSNSERTSEQFIVVDQNGFFGKFTSELSESGL